MHRQIYGGQDAPETIPQKFLPFPNFNPSEEKKEEDVSLLKSSTKKLIEKLTRCGLIPLKVRDALMRVPPSLSED